MNLVYYCVFIIQTVINQTNKYILLGKIHNSQMKSKFSGKFFHVYIYGFFNFG